jgi:hypothetical protein
MSTFNVGDIVTKQYGKKPAKVTYVYGGYNGGLSRYQKKRGIDISKRIKIS